jgi:hypothetical protein
MRLGKILEFGEETRAEKAEEDRKIPEDGKKIEAVAGAGVGDSLLVFLGREVVSGGGGIPGWSSGGSGGFLGSCWRGLERCRFGERSERSEGE